jgi:hypothetical protein
MLDPRPEAQHPFGETCPLLKIAQAYDIDYAIPLAIADWYIHRRSNGIAMYTIAINKLDTERYTAMCEDVRAVTDHTKQLHAYGTRYGLNQRKD